MSPCMSFSLKLQILRSLDQSTRLSCGMEAFIQGCPPSSEANQGAPHTESAYQRLLSLMTKKYVSLVISFMFFVSKWLSRSTEGCLKFKVCVRSSGGWVVKLFSCGARGPGFDSRSRQLNFQRLVISCFQVTIWLKYRWSDVNPQYNQPKSLCVRLNINGRLYMYHLCFNFKYHSLFSDCILMKFTLKYHSIQCRNWIKIWNTKKKSKLTKFNKFWKTGLNN